MKVGFIAPLSIAAVNGGVRTQALQTAASLEELGVKVEFISPWQESIDVDLVHVFNSSPEVLSITSKSIEMGIKTVVSPVFFSTKNGSTIARLLGYEKLIGRFTSGVRSEYGYRAEACKIASRVLPNTSAEAALIQEAFGISSSKIEIVPNGVESKFANATPSLFVEKYGLKDFVLFAGQAGAARKNVIKLLEVAPNIDAPVIIIGSFYENEYGRICRELAESVANVTLIETLPHDSELLSSAYAACDTFVLPSLFETPGIAAMEAALAGAKIVVTEKGGTKDYFGNNAEYVDPTSTQSIEKALITSLKNEKTPELKSHILENYIWAKVAERTLEIYCKL